ncbi:MAG: hypothetical protein CM15mP83_4320 [Flavobacteriaceae bacterium]|nr:MAG: hypothetical protein CM15mP83_4320 [Flavobacteriaceae bacterium]
MRNKHEGCWIDLWGMSYLQSFGESTGWIICRACAIGNLRLVVEREREIENFVPKETFKVQANFTTAEGVPLLPNCLKLFE